MNHSDPNNFEKLSFFDRMLRSPLRLTMAVGAQGNWGGTREWAIDRTGYWLLGLMVVGGLLRLPLMGLGLWREEAATLLNAQGETIWQFFQNIALYENSPPLFFFVMRVWTGWFGTGDWVAKIPAVAIGLLLIPAVYSLGKTVSAPKTGLMAAALVALAPPTVFYSQEIRPYGLVALLVCASAIFYCRLLQSGGAGRRDWIGFVAAMTGMIYTQYTGLVFACGLGLMTIAVFFCRRRLPLGKFAIAGAAIFCLYLPWWMVFLGQFQGAVNYVNGVPWNHALEGIQRPMRVFWNLLYVFNLGIPNRLYLGLGLVAAALIFQGRRAQARLLSQPEGWPHRTWHWHLTVLTGTVVLTGAIEGVLSMGGRYMFLLTPIGAVVLAHGLLLGLGAIEERLPRRFKVRQIGLLVALVWLLVISGVNAAGYIGADKSGVRPLMVDLAQGGYPAGQTVYLTVPDVVGITANYYQGFQGEAVRTAAFRGFPHWDHPELHAPNQYYKAWLNPNLVDQTLVRIEAGGDRYLGLIYSEAISGYLQPKYRAKVDGLLRELKRKYPIVQQQDYFSKRSDRYDLNEGFTFYLFDLANPKSTDRREHSWPPKSPNSGGL
jgi:4-amino-4-deoxy-L-arabinose transferase-like glycosyltransferase